MNGKRFLLLLIPFLLLGADQQLMTGKMSRHQAPATDVLYDRTQYGISNGVYMSVYKVFDKKKALLYTFSITHDRNKPLFFISSKHSDGTSKAITVKYEKAKCGLIYSNSGNMDTVFPAGRKYTYLISFTDTAREYPVLHKITTENGQEFTLDPLSKLRIRKHREAIQHLHANKDRSTTPLSDENQKKDLELFHARLYEEKDSFHSRNSYYSAAVGRMRSHIDKNVAEMLKGKKLSEESVRYWGEKKRGHPDGLGLYVTNGNYYDGNFKEGKFISGTVILKNEAYEYCGGFNAGKKNGIGWLRYKNGNFDLGVFRDDALMNGARLDNSTAGETFFGNYREGQRSGYGELRYQTGARYCGEFANGNLVRGYTKEVDPFGFTTYSRIDNGLKMPADSVSSENFFNALAKSKSN